MTLEQTNMFNPAQTGNSMGGIDVSNEQSPEVQQDVKQLLQKFKQWKKVRDLYSKPWLDYHGLYRGKQWPGNRKSWKSGEVVNMIWQAIQSTAPMQTDARPKFIFLPAEPSDLEFSQLIEKVSEQDWDKWGWMQSVLEVILDGYVFGTGISSMKWDQSKLYGIGAPVYISEEPFYIFPDPDCNDFNDEKSEGMFHAYPVTTSKLKADFPKFAKQIKANTKDWLKVKKSEVKSDTFYNFHNSTTMQMPAETYGSTDDDTDLPKTLVIEGFLRPTDVEESVTNEVGEDGSEKKVYTAKRRYPKGRHVLIACGILLIDEELPFGDGLVPYSKYVNYCDPRNFWGISEVEALESPQKLFNRILCYAVDIMLYCSNPGWKVSTDADVDTDNLTNQPGEVIEHAPGGTVERFQGAQVPPHFMQILDRLVGWFNDVAGQSEFSRGEAPGGVTAASAIEQLIQASRTRVRQKQRNLDVYLKSVGRQYLNRVLEYYTVPRVYRMTNEDGSPYWLKFNIEKMLDDSGDQITSAVLQSYNLVDSVVVPGEIQRSYLRGELDVRVQAGSDLPFEAADKERKALALFDRQIIDAEEVLDQIQYPNKEKLLARLAEKQQQQAAMAAQASQQQVPSDVQSTQEMITNG